MILSSLPVLVAHALDYNNAFFLTHYIMPALVLRCELQHILTHIIMIDRAGVFNAHYNARAGVFNAHYYARAGVFNAHYNDRAGVTL